jgi:hypothetical protein
MITFLIVAFMAISFAIGLAQNSPGFFVGCMVGMMFGGIIAKVEVRASDSR